MPKRKVPSGLKRASGMLMSPVGLAIAKEDRPHAITPVQHARKRRITPCQMEQFHLRNAASAGPSARARRDFAFPRLYQKNKTLPGFPWQGSASTGSGNRLVAGAVIRTRRGNSRYSSRNRGHHASGSTRCTAGCAAGRSATGTRRRATRLRHRVARKHGKENHRNELFHEISPCGSTKKRNPDGCQHTSTSLQTLATLTRSGARSSKHRDPLTIPPGPWRAGGFKVHRDGE